MSVSAISRKEKMKYVCFGPSPFVPAVVMALVTAIVRRLTLIMMFSASKQNGPQPPPCHIKPITFGIELRTYDMIPKCRETEKLSDNLKSIHWRDKVCWICLLINSLPR